jgi:hypothetical protein
MMQLTRARVLKESMVQADQDKETKMKSQRRKVVAAIVVLAAVLLSHQGLGAAAASPSDPLTPWHAEIVDDTGIAINQSSLALDANDYPRIAYWDATHHDLRYAEFDGTNWSTETVHTTGMSGQSPRINVDSNGVSHVAWTYAHNAMYGYREGSTWHMITMCYGCWPGPLSRLALDSDDCPHLGFYHDTNDDLYHYRLDGTSWNVQWVDGTPYFDPTFTDIAIDSLDQPHIVYSTYHDRALKHAWYDGAWHTETIYTDGQIFGILSLALDSSDRLYIAHTDTTRNELNFFRPDGNSWHKEFVGEATYSTGRIFLQLDSLDQAHIGYAYNDGGDNHIRYAYQSASGWNTETVAIGRAQSLALDGAGQPHISYYDMEAEALVYASRNQPPVCSDAMPSNNTIWPPNHEFVPIDVLGVTDPDGDDVTITIDSIFQDEPVDGRGDGNTSPDGQGIGTSTAEVRAERAGSGDGRVYHITFAARDGQGGICTGEILVGVPHDMRHSPVDGGPLYDSTVGGPASPSQTVWSRDPPISPSSVDEGPMFGFPR